MTPAREMLAALQERLPALLLTLVPGEADGRRIFTLLAGPAVDRVEAENLRGPIAEVLTREDPASWSVRETPRAFYLGERGTLREAQDYLASVTTGDLHAYILHVTFPDPEGSESYQVLTGAFAGVRDARPLQLILREAGSETPPSSNGEAASPNEAESPKSPRVQILRRLHGNRIPRWDHRRRRAERVR